MSHRSNEPVSWLPASEYVARRRRQLKRLRRIELLQLALGIVCLIVALVLAVVTR